MIQCQTKKKTYIFDAILSVTEIANKVSEHRTIALPVSMLNYFVKYDIEA